MEELKNFFNKHTSKFIFIFLASLLLSFTYSIRDELKLGNNDGTVTIVAETEKSEDSFGYNQILADITVNGLSIKETDIIESDWNFSSLDVVEPSYSTSGQKNEELKIKVSESVKTVSFHYAKNVNGGKLKVYIGEELMTTIDSYSKNAEQEFVTIVAPSYYGISYDNVFWYLLILFFALVVFLFSKFEIYKNYTRKDCLKFGLTSLGTAVLLHLTSQFLS